MLRPQLNELFDNPVYRILYSKAYVKQLLKSGAILPFLFLAMLLGLYHIYELAFSSVISLGLLIFITVSAVYLGGSILIALVVFEDPVKKSLFQHVADQLVITGLTPWTWLKGHILFCLTNWLFTTVFFLPYMYLAWLLGGIPFLLPLLTIFTALICMISARLITLLLARSPVIGLLSLIGFIAVLIGNIFIFVKSLNGQGHANYPIFSLFSLLSPFPILLKAVSLYSNDMFLDLFNVHINSLGSLPVLLASFIFLHLLFWIFASTNIIAGLPRAHYDIPDKVVSGNKTFLTGFFNITHEPNHRALSPRGLFLLFQQNTFSKDYPKFEFMALTMTSFLTGIILMLIFWQSIVSETDLSTLVLVISTILIFIFSFSVCFSTTAIIQAKKPFKILFPIYFNWILRMLLILTFIFAAYNFSKPDSQTDTFIIVLPILMLLSLVFSIYSSTRSKSFLQALGTQLICFYLYGVFNMLATAIMLITFFGLKSLTTLKSSSNIFFNNANTTSGILPHLTAMKGMFIAILIITVFYCMAHSYFYIKNQNGKNE